MIASRVVKDFADVKKHITVRMYSSIVLLRLRTNGFSCNKKFTIVYLFWVELTIVDIAGDGKGQYLRIPCKFFPNWIVIMLILKKMMDETELT